MKKKLVLVVFEADREDNLADIKKTIEQETSCCSCTLKAIHFSEIHNESEDDLKTFKVSNQEPLSNKDIKDILGISEGGE